MFVLDTKDIEVIDIHFKVIELLVSKDQDIPLITKFKLFVLHYDYIVRKESIEEIEEFELTTRFYKLITDDYFEDRLKFNEYVKDVFNIKDLILTYLKELSEDIEIQTLYREHIKRKYGIGFRISTNIETMHMIYLVLKYEIMIDMPYLLKCRQYKNSPVVYFKTYMSYILQDYNLDNRLINHVDQQFIDYIETVYKHNSRENFIKLNATVPII